MNKCGKCAHRQVCYIKQLHDIEVSEYDEENEIPGSDEECGYYAEDSGTSTAVCAACLHRHSDNTNGKLISYCDILKIRFKDMFGFGCRKFEEKRGSNGSGDTERNGGRGSAYVDYNGDFYTY